MLILFLLAAPAWAQAPAAALDCRPAGADFAYDCVIRLTPAIPGAQVTVDADMPSMPGAHAIKPVRAKRGKAPGEYRARLDLDMQGEWAVKLRLSGAVREEIIVRHHFTESGTAPRK